MSTVKRPPEARNVESQLWLFDPGIDLTFAREAVEDLMSATQAENTKKAYAHSWSVFSSWCVDAGRDALPANPETLRLFIGWCLREKAYRLETVRTHLSGVKNYHLRRRFPSPVDDSVRALIRSAARRLREKPGGKAALTPECLRKICEAMVQDGSAIAVRDRALLLLAFAGAFRRSELSGLQFRDIRIGRRGVEVLLWATKTDQEGLGCPVGIAHGEREATCPVRALRAWLRLRGEGDGPLFRRVYASGRVADDGGLSGEGVNEAVKRWLAVVGVDARDLSAHSCRIGFVTAAGDAGTSHLAIMRTTRHRNIKTVLRYLRPVEAFGAANPLAGVL